MTIQRISLCVLLVFVTVLAIHFGFMAFMVSSGSCHSISGDLNASCIITNTLQELAKFVPMATVVALTVGVIMYFVDRTTERARVVLHTNRMTFAFALMIPIVQALRLGILQRRDDDAAVRLIPYGSIVT